MGYFSNGSEGMAYEARYCDRCVHQGPPEGPGCAVWLAHLLANYDECENKASILHLLIPRSRDGLDNEQCLMFWARGSGPRGGGEPVPVPILKAVA